MKNKLYVSFVFLFSLLCSNLYAASATYKSSVVVNKEVNNVIHYISTNLDIICAFGEARLIKQTDEGLLTLEVVTPIDTYVFEAQIKEVEQHKYKVETTKVLSGKMVDYSLTVQVKEYNGKSLIQLESSVEVRNLVPNFTIYLDLQRKTEKTLRLLKKAIENG